MTVIGLTSLAESKTIIGIDYGKFLVKKYKVFGKIRMYYLLIIFAIINISSLILMTVENEVFRIVNFIVLMSSLIFAIFYFFGYILIENKWVKEQIYNIELLGLYCDSKDTEHLYIDKKVNMNPGTRTSRKISSNVISYFNDFSGEKQEVFREIFGPSSILYDESKKVKRIRKKLFNTERYKYRKSENRIYDISFEFYQLFRYVDTQDKLCLDILRIINGEFNTYKNYDKYRLYNLARTIAQVKIFSCNESIFRYKFLEFFMRYYYATVDKTKIDEFDISNEEKKEIKRIEGTAFNDFMEYIVGTIEMYKDKEFIRETEKVLKEIIIDDKYKGFLDKQALVTIVLKKALKNDSNILKNILVDVLNGFYEDERTNEMNLNLDELKKVVSNFNSKKTRNNKINRKTFFEENSKVLSINIASRG